MDLAKTSAASKHSARRLSARGHYYNEWPRAGPKIVRTYGAERFPHLLGRVGRHVSGGGGRGLGGRAFAAGRLQTRPLGLVFVVVQRFLFHQRRGQIQSGYVRLVIVSLILIHVDRPALAWYVSMGAYGVWTTEIRGYLADSSYLRTIINTSRISGTITEFTEAVNG